MAHVAPPVLSILALFKGPLAGMRFADVDAEGLAALIANAESAGVAVEAAQAKLAELQLALASEQEAVLAFAQRALAYARVYAETHEELSSELNGITLPRLAKPRKANAARVSEPPSPALSTVEADSAVVDNEVTIPSMPPQARAIELDVERAEAETPPLVVTARKSRRNRASQSDVAADQD